MKILLIDPPFKRLTGLVNNYFPLGLSYLAAVAENMGHVVAIYEVDAAKKPTSLNFVGEYKRYDKYLRIVNDKNHPIWQEIKDQIKSFHPDLIGITSMTPKIASAFIVADICKEVNLDCPVVLGGAHPTVSPDQSIAYDSIDFIVRGEGEITFAKLIKKIDAGEKDFSDISGLSYKENGSIKHNPPSEFVRELDEIPFPARDRLINLNQYTSEDMGVILTSRGCPFRCTYCYHPWKGKMHFRSIENVLDEITQVMADYGTRQFAIKDDTFTIKRSHVIEFCEEILRGGLKFNWDCTTRVDRIDEELLKLMIRAGCNVIKVGVETGSEKILKATKKGITFEQVRSAAKLFNKHNIFWSAYFMIGLPQETEEDIIKTYDFMKLPCPMGHEGA
ncbi:MAG: 2-hydroxyethylphosphonate methyltransferase [candidate division WS2 bacterium]|nr:2-hydroxyethylphosphonate methyltransferase [Candidatus Lithacetigena glycinireducens]